MIKEFDFDKDVETFEKIWMNNYDKGVKRNLEQLDITLKDMIKHLSIAKQDMPHIIYHDSIMTYKESNEKACKLANALLNLGCKKGDRISILLPNIPQIIISFMSCYKTGMVAVGFNPRSTECEMKQNLNNHRAETVIVSSEHADKVINLMNEKETNIKNIVVVGPLEEVQTEKGIYDFDTFLESGDTTEPDIAVFPDDIAILLYTGGTTGVPKGCPHTHKALIGEQKSFYHWFSSAIKDKEVRNLVCAPMTHIMGINFGINWSVVNGGVAVIVDKPTREHIVNAINKYEPNMWATVPALMNELIHHPNIKESNIQSLEIVIYGGANTAQNTIEKFKEIAQARLIEGYGMSECVGIVTFDPIETGGKLGSIGVPISNTDVLIVDLETGTKVMPLNEKGEIIFRGPQVIKQYWENPAETTSAIRNGWMFSGDIGYMDQDGCFYLVDRKKDMFTTGGFNVFPREIDEVLFSHPKIYEACTIGIPEARTGEVAKSFIVLKPGESLSEEEVRLFCREKLIAYKVPRLVEFVDEIPKTNVNKPNKEYLKKMERVKMIQFT